MFFPMFYLWDRKVKKKVFEYPSDNAVLLLCIPDYYNGGVFFA